MALECGDRLRRVLEPKRRAGNARECRTEHRSIAVDREKAAHDRFTYLPLLLIAIRRQLVRRAEPVEVPGLAAHLGPVDDWQHCLPDEHVTDVDGHIRDVRTHVRTELRQPSIPEQIESAET